MEEESRRVRVNVIPSEKDLTSHGYFEDEEG